jgi:glycosyltransferase involved in cell wall biosynthesis
MVVHGPYPLGENRVSSEARAAINAGWEVDVIAARKPGEPSTESVDGVRIFRLPFAHTQGAGLVATAREYLGFTAVASAKIAALMSRRRYQVIQVHNPPDLLVLTALVPKLLGTRVIFDIHDFAPELFASRFAGRRFSGYAERSARLLERLAVHFASAVVTAHETYRRALEERGVPAEKITVVLNSLDERLLPAAEPWAESDGFRVVYHGTVTPHYGLELLIEAVAQVAIDEPELRVEIYGDGDAVDQVRARASETGISERVYVSGRFLPHREVLERIRSASAGVVCNLPTAWAAAVTPTKLFEYAALEVPIVAADLPAIRENFSSDEVLFFAPGDATALAEALRQIATDPASARARAEAARRRYDEYRWPHSATRYVTLLEQLRAP